MLSIVGTKQKTNRCINFLPVNFSVVFLLALIYSSLVVILLHILLQQQAMADSMKIIKTPATDAANTKLLISNDNFSSYQNRAFGITIKYPSSWEKIDEESKEREHNNRSIPDQVSSDKQVVEFISPLEHSSDKYQEALSISVHNLQTKHIGEFFGLFDKPMSQKILLHGFILSHITSLITKLPSFDLIKSESGNDEIILADGSLGHKIVYTYSGQGQIGNNNNNNNNNSSSITHLKVMEVLTVNYDRGYIIRYSSEPDKYNSYLPTIKNMINSFMIIAR
jgi:eukaryotic-like serine/threonine-protein kinase